MSHTPGPWRVDRSDDDPRIRSERFGIALVTGGLDDDEAQPVRQANARLLAAAPEMLEALKRLRNEASAILSLAACELKEVVGHTNLKCFDNRIDEADVVIAKAEGK
jgi:hypothetical protein